MFFIILLHCIRTPWSLRVGIGERVVAQVVVVWDIREINLEIPKKWNIIGNIVGNIVWEIMALLREPQVAQFALGW